MVSLKFLGKNTKRYYTRHKEDFQEKNSWNTAICKAFQALQYTQLKERRQIMGDIKTPRDAKRFRSISTRPAVTSTL